MKKAAILIIISILMILILTSCGAYSSPKALGYTTTGASVREWVSPDGVHYWLLGNGLSPRYDSNGNLILDNLEESHR